jgi:hypothetical protein
MVDSELLKAAGLMEAAVEGLKKMTATPSTAHVQNQHDGNADGSGQGDEEKAFI